jgi:hypothetical protein
MKKIAIVQLIEIGHEYDETYLQDHITDWTEVSDQEYNDLYTGLYYLNRNSYSTGVSHRIIVMPDVKENSQKEFVLKTIADYKQHILKLKEEEDRRLAEQERIKLEKKLKRELKTKEQKLKLLAELKAELETDN